MNNAKLPKVPERHILQIIPARNWWAVFNDRGRETASRLVGWALVEQAGEREIIGLDAEGDADVCLVDEISNFRRYAFALRQEDLALELATGVKGQEAA